MARGYTVATVALAVGTSRKWIDNVLSHHVVEGVVQSKQGVARRISFDAVAHLSVIDGLSQKLRMPLDLAVEGAGALASSGKWDLGDGLMLALDRTANLEELHARLEMAVEAAPLPRRGRPPLNAKRGA